MRVAHLSISAVRHTLGAATEALLVASLIAMAAIAFSPVYAPARSLTHTDTAFAAKNAAGYSITLVASVGSAPVAPTYGSTLTTFSAYGNADPAYARVQCWANSSTTTTLSIGSSVYDVFRAVRQGSWNTGGYSSFDTTSSAGWTGGGANCTASLMTYTMHNADRVWKVLATTTFAVLG